MTALPAGLVVPQVRLLDPFFPPVLRVHADRFPVDPLHYELALGLQGQQLGARVLQRAAVDHRGTSRLVTPERVDGGGHSSMPSSSRRSSISSCKIECRPLSTSAIMSRAPVCSHM